MAEELSKEKNRSHIRNSFRRRTSLDGRQSILPHFRQSFASFKVLGSNPRRHSISNEKPTSPVASLNSESNSKKSLEKPKSLKNAGSSSRRIIYPHFRTSFATFNVGGGISRIKSISKPSSSSIEGDVHHQTSLDTHDDGNSKKNSITEIKPSSSSLQSSSSLDTNHGGNSKQNPITEIKLEPSSSSVRSSFLPHYRSSFISWSAVANSRISSAGKQTSSLNGLEINANPRLRLRASNDACDNSCKHGVQDGNEEKHRDKEIDTNPPIDLRASNDACHDSRKHGLQDGNEDGNEKKRRDKEINANPLHGLQDGNEEKPTDKEINANPLHGVQDGDEEKPTRDKEINANLGLQLRASNSACDDSFKHMLQDENEEKPREKEINANPLHGLQDGNDEKPRDKEINANPCLRLRASNDAFDDSFKHILQDENEEKPRDKEINANYRLQLRASNDACDDSFKHRLQDENEEKPMDKEIDTNPRFHLRASNDTNRYSCEHGLQDGNEEKSTDKEIDTNPRLHLRVSNDASRYSCEHGLQDGNEKKSTDKEIDTNPRLHLRASNEASRYSCERGLQDGNEEKSTDKEIYTNPHLHLRASNDASHDSCEHGLQDGNGEKSWDPVTERNIPPMPLKYDHNGRVIGQGEKKKDGTSTPNYSSDSEICSSKPELLIRKTGSSVGSRPVMEEPYASEVSEISSAKSNSELDTMASPKSLNLSRSESLEHDSPRHPQMIKQESDHVQSKPNQATVTIIEAKNENQSEILIESSPPPLTTSDFSSPQSNLPVSLSEDESSEFEFEYTDDQENDYYDSEYTDEESSSETDEIIMDGVEGTNVKDGEGETHKRRTRNKIVHYVGDDSIPVKLKFRRGRIIEIEKDDENGPKRLRFRRGRILENKEEEANGLKRRIYRRRVERIPKLKTSPKAEKVELKHQEMEEKKDLQVLLNDVIEETASKLVEERKSKVKALVGAFETVITTIESAPAAPTITL